MVKVKNKKSVLKKDKLSDNYELILFNDEVNTFDYVIETLVDVCTYDEIRAEQIAMITHFNGKCSIKSGTYYELLPFYEEINRRNLICGLE